MEKICPGRNLYTEPSRARELLMHSFVIAASRYMRNCIIAWGVRGGGGAGRKDLHWVEGHSL